MQRQDLWEGSEPRGDNLQVTKRFEILDGKAVVNGLLLLLAEEAKLFICLFLDYVSNHIFVVVNHLLDTALMGSLL